MFVEPGKMLCPFMCIARAIDSFIVVDSACKHYCAMLQYFEEDGIKKYYCGLVK